MPFTLTRRIAAATLVSLSLGAPAAHAQTAKPLPEPTPIATVMGRDGIAITGTVTGVFGSKFALQDASGQALVVLGPRNNAPEVKIGEKVTVLGRPIMDEFLANALIRADGSRTEIERPRRPYGPMMGMMGPQAGMPGRPGMEGAPMMRRGGPDDQGGPDRGGPDRGDRRGEPAKAEDLKKLEPVLVKQGFAPATAGETHPRHYELRTTDKDGKPVELHIDRESLEIRMIRRL